MFIIDLNNINSIPYSIDFNTPLYYDEYELENRIIEEEQLISNLINTIYLNKDLFIITIIYIISFLIILLIPFFKNISKFNKISLLLSFTKFILLSRMII